MSNQIRTLSLTFNLPIYPRQIKQWRGAFIQMAGWTDDRFHNHNNADQSSPYQYRYPVIQYRVHQGMAGIHAINEGVEALQKILSEHDWAIEWQGKPRQLQVHDLRMNEHYLRMTKTPRTYRLFKYLALHSENYQRWQACRNYQERIDLLQGILVGHLLGFSEAMGYHLPERLEVDIQFVQMMEKVRYHETDILAFNLTYTCNMLLPEGMALGRGVSHGYGWQKAIKVGSSSRKSQNRIQKKNTIATPIKK